MPDRIAHVLNTVVVTGLTTVAAAATALTSATDSAEQQAELITILVPLIGAVIVSGAMIMLNPEPETRRIVIGRAMLALFAGTLGPSILGLMHPSLASLALRPAVLLLVGGAFAGVVYVMSRPFTRELYARAGRIAAEKADELERKYVVTKVDDAAKVLSGAASATASDQPS